jgi:hypothetical protein
MILCGESFYTATTGIIIQDFHDLEMPKCMILLLKGDTLRFLATSENLFFAHFALELTKCNA